MFVLGISRGAGGVSHGRSLQPRLRCVWGCDSSLFRAVRGLDGDLAMPKQ
jgi:hypothetical protein